MVQWLQANPWDVLPPKSWVLSLDLNALIWKSRLLPSTGPGEQRTLIVVMGFLVGTKAKIPLKQSDWKGSTFQPIASVSHPAWTQYSKSMEMQMGRPISVLPTGWWTRTFSTQGHGLDGTFVTTWKHEVKCAKQTDMHTRPCTPHQTETASSIYFLSRTATVSVLYSREIAKVALHSVSQQRSLSWEISYPEKKNSPLKMTNKLLSNCFPNTPLYFSHFYP